MFLERVRLVMNTLRLVNWWTDYLPALYQSARLVSAVPYKSYGHVLVSRYNTEIGTALR